MGLCSTYSYSWMSHQPPLCTTPRISRTPAYTRSEQLSNKQTQKNFNNKASGDERITTELLNKILQKLNTMQRRGTEVWEKGDNTLLNYYKPISLLSHVYKITRVKLPIVSHVSSMTFSLPDKLGSKKYLLALVP